MVWGPSKVGLPIWVRILGSPRVGLPIWVRILGSPRVGLPIWVRILGVGSTRLMGYGCIGSMIMVYKILIESSRTNLRDWVMTIGSPRFSLKVWIRVWGPPRLRGLKIWLRL